MKLKDMVELAANNDECVVLKVKDGQQMNLICLGYFSGNEEIIRLTKGSNVNCTVFMKGGGSFSWCWGGGSSTLVSDATRKMGQLVQQCIERDFGIRCQTR